MRLEVRDRKVLAETFASGVIRRNDLIEFGFFGSACRCNLRLLALRNAGLLRARSTLSGSELRAPFYSCTAKGVRVAAEELDISVAEAIETHRAGTREFTLRHSLRCNDLRCRFVRELGENGELRLIQWSPELLCRHEFCSAAGRAVTMKPDALAVLRVHDRDYYIFIEVDLGNVALPKFKEKVFRYSLYANSGAFADVYSADSFQVLTVTTDERRLANLSNISADQNLFFTTWRRLESESLVGNIFSVRGEDHLTLQSLLARELRPA